MDPQSILIGHTSQLFLIFFVVPALLLILPVHFTLGSSSGASETAAISRRQPDPKPNFIWTQGGAL